MSMVYNFHTEKYEPFDDSKCAEYIPQDETLLNMFHCHIALGKTQVEAMEKCLSAWIK